MKYVIANIPMTLGFAMTMFVVMAIPVMNVFLIPLGVIGATRLHCRKHLLSNTDDQK